MVFIWDTSRSNLVEETIQELVEMITRDSISGEISPKTLAYDLSGKFPNFYFATFRRKNRPKWAEERFPSTPDDPSGFSSLVSELRKKTGLEKVVNSKREVPMYLSHTDKQISKIIDFREMYLNNEISREEAVTALKDDFGILMSESRENYYFPQSRRTNGSLEGLISKLRDARRKIELDLSNTDCLKGLIFEGMVGIYLINRHGPQNVEFQVRKPVFYTDLQGGRHREVYLDYMAEGQHVEVKLQNSLENILDSILPQTFALSQELGMPVKGTVICRSINQELDALYKENVSLEEEAAKMGIHEAGRKIQNVFDYLVFEELVQSNGHADLHMDALSALDGFDATKTPAMKSYVKSLTRIQDNPDGLIEKYSMLVAKMRNCEELSEEDITTFFGAKKNTRMSRDVQRRIEIIRDITKKRDYRFLVEMYNLQTSSESNDLPEEAVKLLARIPEQEFVKLCRSVLEEKNQQRLSRKPRRELTLDDILGFHRRAYERRTTEAVKQAFTIAEIFEQKHEQLPLELYGKGGIEFDSTKYYPKEFSILCGLIQERTRLPKPEIESKLKKVFEDSYTELTAIYPIVSQLAGKLKDENHEIISSWIGTTGYLERAGIEFSAKKIIEAYEDLRGQLNKIIEKQTQEPVIDALMKLRKEIAEKKSRLGKRERDIVNRNVLMLSGGLELMMIDHQIDFFNMIPEICEIHNYAAGALLSSYGNNYSITNWSERTLENMNAFTFEGRLVREPNIKQWYSRVLLVDLALLDLYRTFTSPVFSQIIYFLNRGQTIKNIEELLSDKEKQTELFTRMIDQAFSIRSPVVGLNINYNPPAKMIEPLVRDIGFFNEKVTSENLEGVTRELESVAAMTASNSFGAINKALYSFEPAVSGDKGQQKQIAEKYGTRAFEKLKQEKVIHAMLVSDYLSKKAYNARVLYRYSPDFAVEYIQQNWFTREGIDTPIEEFARMIKHLEARDENTFRDYLTRNPMINGNGNHKTVLETAC